MCGRCAADGAAVLERRNGNGAMMRFCYCCCWDGRDDGDVGGYCGACERSRVKIGPRPA